VLIVPAQRLARHVAAVFMIAMLIAIGAVAGPARAADPAPPHDFVPGARSANDTTLAARRQRAQQKLLLGVELERAHEPAAAIAAYRTAVALDPAIAEANYRMGMLYLTVNQVRPAAYCFAQEVKHHPENYQATREFGLTLARLGRNQDALQRLEPLARRLPEDAETWAALGFAYAGANRPGAADSALRRAIRLDPGVSSWHRDLGAVLAAQSRNDEARREYARAAQLDPRDATPWINLGNLERRDSRFDQALAAYREAAARDSLSPLAVEGEAQTLRALHRDAEAGEIYRRWLDRRPDDHNARLEAVRLYGELGRPDVALELARQGVRFDPRSPDAHLILGMALQSGGDWRGSLAELRRAQEYFSGAEDRARVQAVIDALRRSAPDSLRALFAADSAAHQTLDAPVRRGGSAR
jgi:tetratricopeptide (TPR) repeat protein